MHRIIKQQNKSNEILSATFIIAFSSLFVLFNYFGGFSLAVYAIAMGIAALISVAAPRAGLYAIIFLTFIFERFFTLIPIVMGRNEYKLYPIDVLLLAVIAGLVIAYLKGKLEIKLRKFDWTLIWFAVLSIAYFFISVLILGGEVALAGSSAKNYGFYSLLYFVTYFLIDSKEKLKELATVVFAGGIAIIWFIVYGILTKHGLWSDYTPLSTEGIRTLAFTHGYYVSMVLICALVYMAHKAAGFSKWLLFLVPIWVIGIIGSMMRHLWISVFVAIGFLIVMFARAQRARLKKYALAYTAFAILVMSFTVYLVTLFPRSTFYDSLAGTVGMVSGRVTSIANTEGDESIVWRSAVWQSAGKQYFKSPVTGIGFGKKVSVEIGKYKDFVEVRNMHNSFLVLLVQMGFAGVILVGILVFVLGKSALLAKFNDSFLQMSAYASLGILLMQLVAFLFQPYLEANLLGIFFWINLGVLRRLHAEKQ